MKTPHEDKYRFQEPAGLGDARARKRVLERDIRNIEHQLGDKNRMTKESVRLSPAEYQRWASLARSSLVYKQTERDYLKDWVVERRRQVQAQALEIMDPDGPNQYLFKAWGALRAMKEGKPVDNLGALLGAIEQYFLHQG